MFGLFNNKKLQPSVTPEDKEWVENTLIWFIENFGINHKQQPFIMPTSENFPYTDLNDAGEFQQLFEQLCQYYNVNPNEIIVKFFDDIKSKQWTNWAPAGKFSEAGGLYQQILTTDEKRFNIQLAKSNLSHPQLLVSVIAHELAHVKLLGGNFINGNDPDMEPMTDLASIYFGFGVFVANSVQTQDINWISRSGYLPNQVISYANALLCYIKGHEDISNYLSHFNTNTKELFRNDFSFLITTDDTLLTKEKVSELEEVFQIRMQIEKGFDSREFNKIIEACSQLILRNNKDVSAYNNIGYALLQQKNYDEAIDQFTKAIDIDPYWEYPYNNRGYCKLQMGDIENAYTDLVSSFEMNPDNSYSWRNLGAYYLIINDLENALHYFEEAEKLNPATEMINFYLGHTYLKLGKPEVANEYLEKSKERNEHNDSTIE